MWRELWATLENGSSEMALLSTQRQSTFSGNKSRRTSNEHQQSQECLSAAEISMQNIQLAKERLEVLKMLQVHKPTLSQVRTVKVAVARKVYFRTIRKGPRILTAWVIPVAQVAMCKMVL